MSFVQKDVFFIPIKNWLKNILSANFLKNAVLAKNLMI